MPDQDPSLWLYRKQRSVELLRQQLFAETDLAKMEIRMKVLADAEQELHQLVLQEEESISPPQESILLQKTFAGDQMQGGSEDHSGRTRTPGHLMGTETTGIEAQVLLRMTHVPTGHVHLLDAEKTPLVTFRLAYHGEGVARLRVTSFVEGYSAHAITTVELAGNAPQREINHLPVFFVERIRPVTELTRAALNIQIDDLERKIEQQNTYPIWLLARTSAYLSIRDPSTRRWTDLTPYLAAWVTPNVPEVMELLRRAVALHPQEQIVGYQVDSKGVEDQVRAIYAALKEQDIHYINSIISFGGSEGECMQRVRLPREALENRSANCVDGTLLMASLLEAASLNPAIVLIPGHAFLAWEIKDGSNQWDYLETTMVGSQDFEIAQKAGRLLADQQKETAVRTNDPTRFRLLTLSYLRTKEGIVPME